MLKYFKDYTKEDAMWTTTTDYTTAIPTLEEVKLAANETNGILLDLHVKDPTVAAELFKTVFPYVLNSIVTYADNEDTEEENV